MVVASNCRLQAAPNLVAGMWPRALMKQLHSEANRDYIAAFLAQLVLENVPRQLEYCHVS